MKSSVVLAFTILEGAFLCEATECDYDNCLRAMTNTPDVASSMCSTYIASTTIITITPTVTVSGTDTIVPLPPTTISEKDVPSHISSQCVLGKSTSRPLLKLTESNDSPATVTPLPIRISSACSCMSIVPTTVTSTALAPAQTTTIISPGPCASDSTSSTYTIDETAFNIECNMEPGAYQPIGVLENLNLFSQCIDACITYTDCIGVFWDVAGARDGGSYCGICERLYSPLESYQGNNIAYLPSYTIGPFDPDKA